MMGQRIGDLLTRQTADPFFGRARELALLGALLTDDSPVVLTLHGIGGVGKSRLLEAFALRARARGVAVVSLNGQTIEPTERGFLAELSAATGAPAPAFDTVVAHLGGLGERAVLLIDCYESLRLLDAWLRQVFIPALDAHVRVVLAGREAPVAAWLAAPGWRGLFRVVALEPLIEADALELLRHAGLNEADARRIHRLAGGHPLSLTLAAAAVAAHPDLAVDEATGPRLMETLTHLYLTEVPDPRTRRALQAASVVRRATVALLGAMMPDSAPDEAMERLRALPFVTAGRDGIVIHEVVRRAIAADLRATDPVSHRAYRRAAWRRLRSEASTLPRADLWRYTADMLYLIEEPITRAIFFPPGVATYAVEPAGPDDQHAIASITAAHEGPSAGQVMARWWGRVPHAFAVVRDRTNEVVGYSCRFERSTVATADLQADPVTRAWLAHLHHAPMAAREQALFVRRQLSRDPGDGLGADQAALTLDLKRAYMELRPRLRRVYVALRDLDLYGPPLQRVGFRVVPEARVLLDEVAYHSLVLDFGPGSVDGWLTDLVAAEVGDAEAIRLVVEARELVLDGQTVALTPLEFGLLQYLLARPGRAVSRADLLSEVWDYSHDGGSNVVDAVVRTLRKKLGPHAATIETVTKVGYRFRRP